MTFWNTTLSSTHRLQTKSGLTHRSAFNSLAFAGLLGGLTEILWVILYSQMSSLNAAEVSRQIVVSVIPFMADTALAPWLGVAIHLVLSVLLAFVFGILVWQPLTRKRAPEYTVAAAAMFLVLVWAINFSLVLPLLNPVFVTLMPYPVTFFSKLLFGLTTGAWLYRIQRKSTWLRGK